jgi:serine phosphatase RsbU (regulator of sigma subunit)/DNA-binding response OmpR family regulator
MAEIYSILLAGLGSSEESLVSTHFSMLGHGIIKAGDLADAREKLKSQEIDIFYFQAAADDSAVNEIEEITKELALPVVLMCASPSDGLVLKAWHAGAVDIISLPPTPQSLDVSLQRCQRLLASREFEQTKYFQAKFFFLDESGKEKWVTISSPRFTMGRSSENDLVLSQKEISRSHAEVLIHNGVYQLHDLGSKQGTYLNGIRVEKAKLNNGDRVQLGGTHGISLVFHTGDLLQSLLGTSDPSSGIGLPVHGFKEVGMLFAAFRALSSTPVLDDLLALVLDTAIELTGAERGFIMLKGGNEDLSFRCARNNQRCTLDGSCFQTSRRVPHEVFRTGRSVFIKDLDIDGQPEDHSATRRLGLRSVSCVPLRYLSVHDMDNISSGDHAVTIGVLYVDSSSVGSGFSKSRIYALETLASEAAMAIYNARLYRDSEDKRRMEEQLAFAREIQQALLPPSDRALAYVQACGQIRPCHEVGGDYFDYFDLDGGRFGFALGDVSGKGMPAALLASLIQGVISAQTVFEAPVLAMISNLNRIVAQRSTSSRFVTFFYGILDPDGNCTYVNAGHNPPLLLDRNGSMKELTVGGMVLGLFPEAQYLSDTVKLQPGDHLVLFTDGVIDALDVEGEEFGMERLKALLYANARAAAPEILARLREAVFSFSAQAPQHDDITIMILGFRESKS